MFEASTAGEHLEEDAAECPDVCARVHRLAARLLRAHVGGGAQDHSGLGHRGCGDGWRLRDARCCDARRLHGLRQAEVQDLHRAVGTHLDVRGFQIAMDDALLMRGFESLGDLLRDWQRLVDWDRALCKALRQVVTFDQFHHEGVQAGRLLEAVNRGDVGMIQRRERLRLALETCQAFGVRGERARQDLDRDLSAQRRVGGAIHLTHAPFANRGRDLVDAEAGAGTEGQV